MIGDPVRHSLSPVIHNAAFEALGIDWVYVAFEVPAGRTEAAVAAMRVLGIDGLSVTMPHKAEIPRGVDESTAVVERLGAANTVTRRGSRLVADSTDGVGFLDALAEDEGWAPDGARCLVVGAGGAARSVIDALGRAGAREVVVVNRTPARGESAAALAGARGRVGVDDDARECDLVVNATPLGMAGVTSLGAGPAALPLAPDLVGPGQLVVDLVYEPLETAWLRAARARGATTVTGVGMLIHQAAHQLRQWTGEPAPLPAMSAAVLAELSASSTRDRAAEGSDRSGREQD